MLRPTRVKSLLTLLALLTLGTWMLQSCQSEPLSIPKSEQYEREFIKQFGSIDPNHTWSAATHGTVTVRTSAATDIRIIGDYSGTTYTFGNYTGVNGEQVLTFDVPMGVTNTKLRVGGRRIAFTPGETVDLTSGRTICESVVGDETYGTHTVTIQTLVDENKTLSADKQVRTFLTLTEEEILNVAKNILPEEPDAVSSKDKTNLDKVTDNFFVNAQEFYIFPQYQVTSRTGTNIIGVYYYTNSDNPDATKVWDRKKGAFVYVQKVQIFSGENGLLKGARVSYQACYEPVFTTNEIQALVSKVDNLELSDGTDKYKDQSKNIIVAGKLVTIQNPAAIEGAWDYGCYKIISNWELVNTQSYAEAIAEICDKYFYDDTLDNTKIKEQIVTESDCGGFTTNCLNQGYDHFRSYGVHVKFDKPTSFGFYIQLNQDADEIKNEVTRYSQVALNGVITCMTDEAQDASFVATTKEIAGETLTDTEGNTKRYLCFEDWFGADDFTDKDGVTSTGSKGNYNFDLNDMVFRVYGFDDMADPEDDFDGEVVDEDEPEKEYEPIFPWIVACEDLGGTFDFDFNDVVFGVQHASGTNEVYVTALAAGGTLPVELCIKDASGQLHAITGSAQKGVEQEVNGILQETVSYGESGRTSGTMDEWHNWFNAAKGDPVNVKGGFKVGATVRITLPEGVTCSMSHENSATGVTGSAFMPFVVRVTHADGPTSEITMADPDATSIIPQMFVTTAKFKWPQENVPIYTSHPGDKSKESLGTVAGNSEVEAFKGPWEYYENGFAAWAKDQTNNSGFHEYPYTHAAAVTTHIWKGYEGAVVEKKPIVTE